MSAVTTEFTYLQRLVHERSAIVLSDDKEYLVDSRLQSLARELGLDSAEAVLGRARQTGDRLLEERIVEAMTTNETLWFRDLHPFDAIRKTVLPEIIGRRRPARKLSAWSAACSTGQELYSLAMLIDDSFPDVLGWDLALHGTDLSDKVVSRARWGAYSMLEINRGLPASMLVRNFTHDGASYRIREDLRRLCGFRRMNLAEQPWPVTTRYDLIMLRNVLIYFDLATRKRVLEAAACCLDPEGYLFVGASETMMGVTDAFETETADGATFYRLKGRS